ncbi:MAG TPA: DUF5723 family protein [Longimicrobiales bacterium]|nr:DUF5723 family protein [Longimicrobiales bacterium]
MRTMNRTPALVAVVALTGLFQAGAASAQLAHASARTLGLGGNATATASRLEAISVNPAGLGMPGAGFSLTVLPMTFRSALGPVSMKDLNEVAGEVISSSVKEAWLAEVLSSGGETGSVGGEITALAFTAGHFGFQMTTLLGADANLAPEVMEVVLYGNAGRTGTPANISFSGSEANAFAVTTLGAGYGLPIKTAKGSMALGATLKYSVGHLLAVAREKGGSLQSDPIKVDVEFPSVVSGGDDYDGNGGSGVGLDVGFQMQRDKLHLGAAVQNLFNTFAWDDATLEFRPGTATLQQGDNNTDFDAKPYASAPADLKAVVDDMKFDPTLAVGGAYDVKPDFTLSADLRTRFGDGMSLTPKTQVGAGAEYRGIGPLHLRGGLAAVTGGFQLGGGASLILGPVNMSFAAAMLSGDTEGSVGQFTLSFGGR